MVELTALAAWCGGVLPQGAAVVARVAEALEFDHPQRIDDVDALIAGLATVEGGVTDIAAGVAAQIDADAPPARWLARQVLHEAVSEMAARWEGTARWGVTGEGHLTAAEIEACVLPLHLVAGRHQALVIGATAGAAIAARELTRAGASTLMLVPTDRLGSHGPDSPLAAAARTRRLTIALHAQTIALHAGRRGLVESATVRSSDEGFPVTRDLTAREFFLGAGAVESARLLLASRSEVHPAGLGNTHDQVGRHLQVPLTAGALGVFGTAVGGPWPDPVRAVARWQDAGVLPLHGESLLADFVDLLPRVREEMALVPTAADTSSRITLDPRRHDAAGMPLARLKVQPHPDDLRAQAAACARLAGRLRASGARTVVETPGWSDAVDAVGTLRRGDDPASSATGPDGRVWGHLNLWVVDASLLVSSGADPERDTAAAVAAVMRRAGPITAG